ncbi:hypothetical protein ML401_35645 (plasmid) [Bradyrhizobium sp. 62B]|nr:hypothetical protein ML401_35645 [Bradyrhizobium sp. 62B]
MSRKLGKPRDWVSRYASVQSMPEFLGSKLMNSTRLGVSSPTPSRPYVQHRRASPTPTPPAGSQNSQRSRRLPC